MENNNRQRLAIEAKAIVALAFRNGPIEGIHAGTQCPTCSGEASYSRITDAEIKEIMKSGPNPGRRGIHSVVPGARLHDRADAPGDELLVAEAFGAGSLTGGDAEDHVVDFVANGGDGGFAVGD